MFPPWITPVLCWNLIQTITGLTVTFTASRSRVRPIVAALTALLAYALTSNIRTYFSGTRPSGPVVSMCWVNVLNAIDLLVLSRASFEAQLHYKNAKDEKKEKQHTKSGNDNSASLSKKLLFALEIPYNYRRINTPWQIRVLPAFNPRNPASVPTKTAFLLQSTLKLAIAGTLIHLLTIDAHNPHLSSVIAELDDSKSVLALPFRTRTPDSEPYARRLLIQALFTLSFGIVTRATIVGGYTSGSILAVLLGGDPADYPPIAGSLAEAWNLRRLWSLSWHQLLRKPLTSNATFLASCTLGIDPTSAAAHWVRVALTFAVSGVVHSLLDIGFGVPLSKTGGVYFYSLQILGFVIESVVGSMYRRVGGRFGLRLNPAVERGVGYVWVAAFLLWSTPVWINPILKGLWGDGTRVMSPWLGLSPEVVAL
ncbi:wax synthase family protein [Aspergillus lucknowensis]|uniref:Membrane bound O-acyl transferase family-domain-containing protein n=1 Tax=Aspergillus lucknowensis TaxID=176173 RepID=A0ABR4LZZ8_9EURO